MNVLLLESDDNLGSVLSEIVKNNKKNSIKIVTSVEEMFHSLEYFQYDTIIVEFLTLDGFANDFFKYIKKFDKKPKIIFITHQEETPINSVVLLKKPFSLNDFEQSIDFIAE